MGGWLGMWVSREIGRGDQVGYFYFRAVGLVCGWSHTGSEWMTCTYLSLVFRWRVTFP